MFISHASKVEGVLYDGNGAKGALKKVLITEKEGWKDYVMRLFEISPGGNSPLHTHPWPHIVFVVDGKGTISVDGTEYEAGKGTYAYVPENIVHQFVNNGEDKLSFICIVPPEGN